MWQRAVEWQGNRIRRAELKRLDVRPLARDLRDRELNSSNDVLDQVLGRLLGGAHL